MDPSFLHCLRNRTPFLLVPLLFVTSTNAQARKSAPQTTVLLVDTDDACRLTVDDQDQGIITPAQSKKITISLGDHIVKCVVDGIPDLVWRKIVEAQSSQQVAAIIALKALHVQYDQAARNAQQQRVQQEKQQEQKAANDADRKTQQNLLLLIRNRLIGTWQGVSTSISYPTSKCPDIATYTHTYTIYVDNQLPPDVLAVNRTDHFHFHGFNQKTCKPGDQDHNLAGGQGTIRLATDFYPIEFVCDGCDDADRAKHLSELNTVGVIHLMDGDKLLLDNKQPVYKLDLVRVR